MLIEKSTVSTSILQSVLANEGYDIPVTVRSHDDIFKNASDKSPDLIIANVDIPDETLLLQLKYINDVNPLPVVIFSQHGSSDYIESAVKAGVSAFIVDGLSAERVKPVIEVALARFNSYNSLRNELEKTRESLASRKIIEKAKGLIMEQKQCSEELAYNSLRKLAMDRNKKIVEVSQNVIDLSSLLA
jgi:response regulator NasT